MTEATTILELRAGGASLLLAPADGGRVATLRVDGVELLKSTGMDAITWGMYPMVPWAGRLRDGILTWRGAKHHLPTHLLPPHALHGTLLESAWETVSASAGDATLGVDLVAPWPFGGRVTQRIALAATGDEVVLRVALRVEADAGEFPAVVGWHPWFPRVLRGPDGSPVGAPAELDFAPGGMLERGEDYLPTGRILRPAPGQPWDDCFVDVARPPVVRWPGAFEVAIESDCAYWVCYTEPPDALCIEPQTGPPNGLNTGECFVVGPGRPLEAAATLRWRRLA